MLDDQNLSSRDSLGGEFASHLLKHTVCGHYTTTRRNDIKRGD